MLGGHVRRCSDDPTFDRVLARRTPLLTGLADPAFVVAVLADVFGKAPVDDDGLAKLTDEDVRRLQIAMDHVLAMRVSKRVSDRDHGRQ